MAAVAKSLYGIGRDCADFVYLHLTNGLGGIISNGPLCRGHWGNAGDFGGIWTVSVLEYPNLFSLLRCVLTAGGKADAVELKSPWQRRGPRMAGDGPGAVRRSMQHPGLWPGP
ncbi:ROK family protein [Xanthomonas campestris]|uniref:ROK family protein n=1 Tax=Xanthomonas campestris pv. papavericola TaxID=487881 RepID=A0AAJ2X5W2_XANCA|nr:ROK family protein [Xanthomonas campestris]MEC3889827.1 ROK family protein [Xanthomonas campestris pv. papavericola]